MCTAGKDHLEKVKRFDMPGFAPLPQYVREMKRFGIITGAETQIDPYQTDEAYWQSFHLTSQSQ